MHLQKTLEAIDELNELLLGVKADAETGDWISRLTRSFLANALAMGRRGREIREETGKKLKKLKKNNNNNKYINNKKTKPTKPTKPTTNRGKPYSKPSSKPYPIL